MNNTNKMVIAVKGVIINEGRVLIVKRSDDDEVGGGTWECVGGKIDFGEELENALEREIKEEVSLDVIVKHILFATTFKTNPTRQVVILTYLCTSSNQDVVLSKEHSDYRWVTKEQLKTYLPLEMIRDFEKYHVFSLL